MSRHVHLHINIQRTMSREHITGDVERAFHQNADTIGMCELETQWHHTEVERVARERGYSYYLPTLGARGSALGLAVKKTYGSIVSSGTTLCAPGLLHVSPSRYINRIQVQRHADRELVSVAETHQYSSGWTGSKSLDVLRRARWHLGMNVVGRVERSTTANNVVTIGGGDLNRPPSTFKGGVVLGGLLSRTGLASTGYAHTDATHGGTTFDYLWFLSRTKQVSITSWSTPSFWSDHDGILAELEW